MQKLLVSDYDGTYLDKNGESGFLLVNKRIVTNFINNDNIFAFASGRNFVSLKGQTKKYNLPYNYLICNNGTSIFNSKDEVLHFKLIPHSLVIKTIDYLDRKNIILSRKYLDLFGNETTNFNEVAEIVCTVNIETPEILEEVKNEINFLQSIFFTKNSSQLCTVSDGKDSKSTQYLVIKEPSDKKEAISFISSREGIDKKSIYTIGNDFNDYEMLKCYNGFKMIDSRSELELLDVPEISSVYELVKRIEG